jgi:hypothetical protein
MFLAITTKPSVAETWRGLFVEPENRCTPYDKKKQYPYSQSVEDEIVASMGGYIYGPYTSSYFDSDSETDIEHIVSTSEAHDSGLCRASGEIKKQFATDLLNLTLAAPKVNRCSAGGKCGYDAGEWIPEKNKCWFANRVLKVKTKYKLSVDINEAVALEHVLSNCSSLDMIIYPSTHNGDNYHDGKDEESALQMYDDNGNGRISCSEAKNHSIAPVRRGHAAYSYMRDADGDGVVCEL